MDSNQNITCTTHRAVGLHKLINSTTVNCLYSKVILALLVKLNEILNHVLQINWSFRMCHENELVIQPRLACCASKPRFQSPQHAERPLAFDTCDRGCHVDSCKNQHFFEQYIQLFLVNIAQLAKYIRQVSLVAVTQILERF